MQSLHPPLQFFWLNSQKSFRYAIILKTSKNGGMQLLLNCYGNSVLSLAVNCFLFALLLVDTDATGLA